MDINQIELSRETIFKDAVLSQAEAKSMEIIAEAGKKRAEVLEEAYKLCERADYDTIKAHMAQENEREFATVAGEARRELLHHREKLVEELFGEVEQNLTAFTRDARYPAWVAARAVKHADMAAGGAALAVLVRPADVELLSAALQKALPGCVVRPDEDILLGGCKVSDGRRLQDETLDDALRQARETFYFSGRMRMRGIQKAEEQQQPSAAAAEK